MPRLLCLPGLLCTPDVFAGVLEDADTDSVALALPDSDSFDDIASSLVSSLPDRAVLVGMSMGGYLALEIARRAPDRVAGLVLIGCTAAADSEKAAAQRGKVVAWARREGIEELATSICNSLLGPASRDNAELRASVARMARSQGLDVFARHQAALAGRPDNSASLPAITCPVLVMAGADDTVTPPQVGRDLADRLPRGRFVEIEGAGHLAVIERPAVVAAHLNAFMRHDMKTGAAAQ